MNYRLLRPAEAANKTGISLSHLYLLVTEDKFPRPIKISDRVTAFVESEVDQWISEKIQICRK